MCVPVMSATVIPARAQLLDCRAVSHVKRLELGPVTSVRDASVRQNTIDVEDDTFDAVCCSRDVRLDLNHPPLTCCTSNVL